MINKIAEIIDLHRDAGISSRITADQILSLLDESKNGVSDSLPENGGLPHVRKSGCEATVLDTVCDESEQGTLENRIDSGNGNECKYHTQILRIYKDGRPAVCELCGKP